MGCLVSEDETQIRYFDNNYPKLALKNYTNDLPPGFPHCLRITCPNFKKVRRLDKPKRSLVTFVPMTLVCPVSNGMYAYQSAPKVMLHPNKDFIFIMELYKLEKIGRKSTRKSL